MGFGRWWLNFSIMCLACSSYFFTLIDARSSSIWTCRDETGLNWSFNSQSLKIGPNFCGCRTFRNLAESTFPYPASCFRFWSVCRFSFEQDHCKVCQNVFEYKRTQKGISSVNRTIFSVRQHSKICIQDLTFSSFSLVSWRWTISLFVHWCRRFRSRSTMKRPRLPWDDSVRCWCSV